MTKSVQQLLSWYRAHGRSLPWRNTKRRDGKPDAYRIFISELMLQQTQVPRVIPKYQDWLKQFPTWKALAAAKTPALIHTWAGLGYNRRALQAREAAQYVITHGEPTDEAGWRQLKGVGPYMAAALTEFANHSRAIVIDTNVRRVAGRVFLGKPHPRPEDDVTLKPILETETPRTGKHWDLPQAFMDLGSLICTPRLPACPTCPLRTTCKATPLFLSGKEIKRTRTVVRERIQDGKKYPDRIYRGRILGLVREQKRVPLQAIGPRIDPEHDPIADTEWLAAMVERLVKDKLLAIDKKENLSLPKE